MLFAVVQISGKQYLVEPGRKIEVENFGVESGKTIKLDEVLLVGNDTVSIGKPYLKNYSVTGKILRNFAGTKLTVTKFRSKSRYLRRTGFRQKYTEIEILKINNNSKF